VSKNNGSVTGHDKATGRFVPGHSEWHAKRRRIDAIAKTLAVDYDADSGAAKALLHVAAGHIDTAARARSQDQRNRATRMAAKTLALIPKAPEPDVYEYLNAGAGNDAA
jgi:hypothetical protein